jgi:hypothetical protein
MTHLILHKVRGEPAFDIAEKLQIGDEEGWIIPTSGHRAYPYWVAELTEFQQSLLDDTSIIPSDLPDHYACNDDNGKAPEPSFNIMSIISNLSPKFLRRL